MNDSLFHPQGEPECSALVAVCVRRPKLDTDSGPQWTAVPGETGQ